MPPLPGPIPLSCDRRRATGQYTSANTWLTSTTQQTFSVPPGAVPATYADDTTSPWANSKKTSLNGCSFLSPGRKVCLLILKEEGLKMMNPFVGRKKSCRMLSKRNLFPSAFGRPLSSADTRPGARRLPAFKLVRMLTSIGLQLRHAWRSL